MGGILGGISSLLFGSSNPTNPQMGNVNSYLGNAGGIARTIGATGQQALNNYGVFNPQANQAVEAESNYLTQDPYTSSVDTALLANATKGTTDFYNQARSKLQSQLADRGMIGSGLEAGALADVGSSEAATLGNAQNNLALSAINQLGANKAADAELLSGAAGTAYNQGLGAEGAAANINQAIASEYGGLGNQQEAYQMDAQNAQNNDLLSLGADAATIFGGGGGGGGVNPAIQPAPQVGYTPSASPGGAASTPTSMDMQYPSFNPAAVLASSPGGGGLGGGVTPNTGNGMMYDPITGTWIQMGSTQQIPAGPGAVGY